MAENILPYESIIWNTADLLRGCGITESEAYPGAFDNETRWLRGMEASDR